MSDSLNLKPVVHTPESKKFLNQYDSLVGIEDQKEELQSSLRMILNPMEFKDWIKKHDHAKSTFLNNFSKISPLILLSGDVGCGKSELANSCASALAKKLNSKVLVFSTPSDLRGRGKVGEISARITTVFNQLVERGGDEPTILILDEADDVASSREEDQQHREDRAGVNALIKELDNLERKKRKVAVLFITNRSKAMDPAILRRAAVEIKFDRPDEKALKKVVQQIAEGLEFTNSQKEQLLKACLKKDIQFTYSDLYRKVVKQAIINCWKADIPFNFESLLESIQKTNPSPKFSEL